MCVTAPPYHRMIVPRFAVVYTWMCAVLVSIGTDELCKTWKLSIGHMGQTVLPKEAHYEGGHGVPTGIVSGICAIPDE